MSVDMNLPPDLVAFLRDGKRLRYWSKYTEMGAVTLKQVDKLRLENIWLASPPKDVAEDPHKDHHGYYVLPIVDLCETASYTAPQGLLIWVPAMGAFGTWDCDHGILSIFPDVSWRRIRWRPRYYLEVQWQSPFGTAKSEKVKPWEHGCEFRSGELGQDILAPIYQDSRGADLEDAD